MKLVGKPYAGKLHVRFDEGVERIRTEIEVFPITAYPFTLLYCLRVFINHGDTETTEIEAKYISVFLHALHASVLFIF